MGIPVLRVLIIGLGALWSGLLLVVGFWVWDQFAESSVAARLMAIASISAGEFVLMWVVLDEVLQRADAVVTGFCKAVAGVTFWAALGLTGVLMGVAWVS